MSENAKDVMRRDLGHTCPVTDSVGRRCRLLRGHNEDHVYSSEGLGDHIAAAVRDETVNHPTHYGGDVVYEHWKVMVAWGLQRNAFLYNATKYICRSGGAYVGRKNAADPLEDLKKARWYLDKAIEQAEAASKGLIPETMLSGVSAHTATFLARRDRREATCLELGCDNIGTPARHSVYCEHYVRPPQNIGGPIPSINKKEFLKP